MKKKSFHKISIFLLAFVLAVACIIAINVLFYFIFRSVIEERDSADFYHKMNLFKNLLIIIMILLLFCAILTIQHQIYSRQRAINAQHLLETKEKERELLEERLKKEELMNTLAETQIQNTVQQLQPHFLYNSLSSIREIVLDSPEYAADLLLDFTVYLRSCLRALSIKGLIPFEQELNNIRAYANIEKMRFGEKLTVEYDIRERAFSIIPLGVQPLVENAIRHGIGKKRYQTGTVKIQTYREKDCIVIRVEDNGTGFNVEEVRAEVESGKRDSTGITSLRVRYEKQMNAVLECVSEAGKGTVVCIRIPAK